MLRQEGALSFCLQNPLIRAAHCFLYQSVSILLNILLCKNRSKMLHNCLMQKCIFTRPFCLQTTRFSCALPCKNAFLPAKWPCKDVFLHHKMFTSTFLHQIHFCISKNLGSTRVETLQNGKKIKNKNLLSFLLYIISYSNMIL